MADSSTQPLPLKGQPDLTGSTVGRFNITARLGAGGMGEVYRAEDKQLKRTVAIKRLAPRIHNDERHKKRFLREAQRTSALNHPHIAAIYDVLSEGNELFLVMEYVDGPTLRERISRLISVSDFEAIAVQCAEALAAAHEHGILHGDLKPENIMLTRVKNAVKICDFGLARQISTGDPAVDETVPTFHGVIAGTPAYIAPEVILEKPVDARADIFSLGVVFYEMLTGRNPFQTGNLMTTLDRIRTESPMPVDQVNREVNRSLAQIIARMLEKEPELRFSNGAELLTELLATQTTPKAPQKWRQVLVRYKPAGLRIAALIALLAVVTPALQKWRINWWRFEPAIPEAQNLAVLPLLAAGLDGHQQISGQGLMEILNAKLSRLTVGRKFQVAPARDVRTRGVKNADQARKELGANLALTSSLRYSGEVATLTLELIDTISGKALRQRTVTADISDTFTLQDRAGAAVVDMLGLDLKPHEKTVLATHGTMQPSAYDFYLQGQGYLQNYERLENLDSSITVFRRALEIDSRYALAYSGLGEAYWRKYELTKSSVWVEPARAACEGALGIDSTVAPPHACLGMVLNGLGQNEKAAEEFRLALDLEPTNDLLYLGLATAYEKLGRSAEAEQTYIRAIDLRPHYWSAYSYLGVYFFRLERNDEALAMFQQVIALAPDSFRGYSNLGAVYFKKDQIPEAIAAYEKSLSIRPNYPAASNLGTLYYYEGQYQRSAEAFRQALSINGSDDRVWGNLGSTLRWANDPDGSAEAYKHARQLAEERVRVNPRDAAILMSLAEYNASLGEKDKAFLLAQQALKLAPDNPSVLFRTAVIFEFHFGQRDKALSWLAKAVEHGQTWKEIDRAPTLRALRQDPRFKQLRQGG